MCEIRRKGGKELIRGTQNLFGDAANKYMIVISMLETWAKKRGFQRFIPSALVEPALFDNQLGNNRVFTVKGQGDRDMILLPEVTAVARKAFNEGWNKSLAKPVQLFYTSRCYRYDRPQRGRWREFTQFGIEIMPSEFTTVNLLREALISTGLKFELKPGVKRGLAYYNDDGFEAWSGGLQIAGGGPYKEGAGWAIGVERLMLCLEEQGEF